MAGTLVIMGLGYSGAAVGRATIAAGWHVTGTTRTPGRSPGPKGVEVIPFHAAASAIAGASHLLVTAPPGEGGDPVLAVYGGAVAQAAAQGSLRWIGYVSTTGVYGDRGGAWVDEATEPAPRQKRSRLRLEAEQAWRALSVLCPVDLMRAGGIYGPGRSPFDQLRAGTARRVLKPGHAVSRIHRDDIAQAVLAAMEQARGPGARVLHLVDDEPAENAAVMEEAARLLGIPPPPAVPFAEAAATMSPMALSFWEENRRVSNAATKALLGVAWRYPTYREGLRAILLEEGREGPLE